MRQTEPYQNNFEHLQGELRVLNLRLHRQMLRWRAAHHDEATADELQGLLISDREADKILDGLYAASAPSDADAIDRAPISAVNQLLRDADARHQAREQEALNAGTRLRLPELAVRLSLNRFEKNVALLALAPEIDLRYERLFGYLNDDVTRRFPTVSLALQLFCDDLAARVRRRRSFSAAAPLRCLRIIDLTDAAHASSPALPAQGLLLDDWIAGFLTETDTPDAALISVLSLEKNNALGPKLGLQSNEELRAIAICLAGRPAPAPVVVFEGPDDDLQRAAAHFLANACRKNMPVEILDGAQLSQHPNPDAVANRILRRLKLRDTALAVESVEALLEKPVARAALMRLLLATDFRPRFLFTRKPVEMPHLGAHAPMLHVRLAAPAAEMRLKLWTALLDGHASKNNLAEAADRFRLKSAQIAAAARQAATRSAVFRGNGRIDSDDLFTACKAQSSAAISELAECIRSIHTWDDLVLPLVVKKQLQSLEQWTRHRATVYETWGFSERIMLGRGLSVLFTGPSGTGKTMAAGILARALSLDLYRIDLSSVVSKYIGETEKNLSKVFETAESSNAILFFDEADALFGKRSEVKDAHDRYANIEVSYLLQRMEAYDGVAILATNFRQNIDQAFARRLQAIIDFPFPSAPDRERIWRRLLPESMPRHDDVDLGFLARRFTLSGGNIKNCALAAAFSAAAEGASVSMRHLIRAVGREFEKIGQPILQSDFGAHHVLLREITDGN